MLQYLNFKKIVLSTFLIGFLGYGELRAEPTDIPTTRTLIGIAIDYGDTQAHLKDNYETLGQGIHSNKGHISKTFKISPSLEFGTWCTDKFYIGLHAGWHHMVSKHKTRNHMKGLYNLTDQLHLKNYFELLLKPGYKVGKRLMVYAKCGPSLGSFRHDTTQFNRNQKIDTFNVESRKYGLIVGFGAEYQISPRYFFSVDFTYGYYQRFKGSKTFEIIENVNDFISLKGSGVVKKSIRPSHSTLSLRISYLL